jgi:quercetin dioxygenase-like cupin family protein
VKAGVKMSQLYYEPAEPWAYAVFMNSEVFVVQRDVDRWGKRIDCSVSPFVKVSSRDTGGAWSMFEGVVAPGFAPPLHLHYCQEEWFQVNEGEFIFEADGTQYALKPGESILIPRMIAHRFQNTGTSAGRVLILTQPSGTLEKFFEEFLSLLEYTGVSPIVFTRIARFESALRLKGSSSLESWTAIAHMLGYHDQMHMTRDFMYSPATARVVRSCRLSLSTS